MWLQASLSIAVLKNVGWVCGILWYRSIPMLTTREVLHRLAVLYPDADCTLDWKTPFQLLIATILAAQCTDARVNRVTKDLFQKYQSPQDFLRVSEEELQNDIRSCGSYRMKARAIQETCRTILHQFHGNVPQTMEGMLQLRGVGRKTAAVVLGTAFGVLEGIPIDTHNIRLLQRMGLTQSKNPDRIELEMMSQTPKNHWLQLSHLMVAHGRAVCTARNRQCDSCPLQQDCPSSLVCGRGDLAKH